MPVINNLSLRDTLGAGIEAKERSEFNALRNDAFRAEQEQNALASQRANQQFNNEQLRANTEWLVGASQFAMDNPDAIPAVIQKGQQKGIIAPDLDISNVPAERIQELLREINQNALAELGGPETPEDTTAIAEFKFARSQGYKGSFADWKAQNIGSSSAAKPPASIAEYNLYSKQVRALGQEPIPFKKWLETIAPAQVINLAGGRGIFNPVDKTTTDLSTAEEEATGQAEVAGAVAAAKTTSAGLAKRNLELPQAKSRLSATEFKMDSLRDAAQSILDDKALWQAVGLGKGLSKIPGSAGARVKAKIDGLQSKSGLAVLQDIRDNSKTGGAVGQVSDFEQQLFQNNIAPLANLNVSPEDYRAFVQAVVDYANGAKGRFRDAFFATYPELVGGQSPDESQQETGEVYFNKQTGQRITLQNGQWVNAGPGGQQ